MDTVAQLVGSVRAFVGGTVASLVATVVFMLATGQPITLAPSITRVLHAWWPIVLVVCILLYALTIGLGVALTRRQRGSGDTLPDARAGDRGVAITAERVESNTITIDNTAHHDYSRTTYIQGNGAADELRRARHRPDEAGALMRGLGDYANAGDADWEHIYDTTGAHRLRPRHPGAHIQRPLRVYMEMRTRPGEPTFPDLLLRAWEDQQPVTIDPDSLTHFQEFLGDDLMRDLADDPGARITTVIEVQPSIPPRRCIYRVVETGDTIRNLDMAWFTLPDGRDRFTNRHDQAAPVWVAIDIAPQSHDGDDAGSDGAAPRDPHSVAVQFVTRPVPERNARHLLALYDVLYSLQERRHVEVIDDVTSEVVFAGCVDSPQPLASEVQEFREALRAVQDAFPATVFDMSGQSDQGDMNQLFRAARIVAYGTMDGSLDRLEMTSPAVAVRKLLGWVDERGVLHPPDDDDGQPGRVTITDPDDEVVRLFDATISLGEKAMELETARIVGDVDELRARVASLADDATLRIALGPADPAYAGLTLRYERFPQRL